MHSAQRPSLKAPASESERRGRVLPPPSPLKPASCTMMNTNLPTDRAPTRVQELTLSLPGRAGTSSSSGCRVEIICPHTLRCCYSRCRSCGALRQPRRLSLGSGSAAFQRRQHRGRRLAAARRGRVARQGTEAGARMEKAYKSVGVLGARVDLPRHQSSGAARGNVMIWCRTTSTRTWRSRGPGPSCQAARACRPCATRGDQWPHDRPASRHRAALG